MNRAANTNNSTHEFTAPVTYTLTIQRITSTTNQDESTRQQCLITKLYTSIDLAFMPVAYQATEPLLQ